MLSWPCTLQPSPLDMRDWQYAAVKSPPQSDMSVVDWTHALPTVRDQGNEGTCAAHAGACVKEAQERVDTGNTVRFSPRFIYTLRENNTSAGMYLRDLMVILSKYGACTEETCPYEAGHPLETLEYSVLMEGSDFKIEAYARCNTVAEVKSALKDQGPCVAAFPVYDFGPSFWLPKEPMAPAQGGHAVAIIGYDDSRQAFHIRNSWGASWNGDGHTWFPYSEWGAHWEVWSSVDKKGSRYQPKPKPEPPVVDRTACIKCK